MKESLRKLRHQRRPNAPRRRPAKLLPWLLLCLAFIVLGGAGIAVRGLLRSPWLRASNIRVGGCARVPEAAVRSIARPQLGQPILSVDLGWLRRRIESIPAVHDAVVARRLPHLIDVTVHERRAVARCLIRGRRMLIDGSGALFSPGSGLPHDEELALVRGLKTPPGASVLSKEDTPALETLAALERVIGRPAPPGTIIDLSVIDRIVLKPGADAPALWLDREHPEMNLEKLFAWKRELTKIAGGDPVDLRFPNRLTVAPVEGATTRR